MTKTDAAIHTLSRINLDVMLDVSNYTKYQYHLLAFFSTSLNQRHAAATTQTHNYIKTNIVLRRIVILVNVSTTIRFSLHSRSYLIVFVHSYISQLFPLSRYCFQQNCDNENRGGSFPLVSVVFIRSYTWPTHFLRTPPR